MPDFSHIQNLFQRSKKSSKRPPTERAPETASTTPSNNPGPRDADVLLSSLDLSASSDFKSTVSNGTAPELPPTASDHADDSGREPVVQDSLNSSPVPPALHGADQSVKKTTWSGFKLFVGLLDASSDAFGPLKSAVGGFKRCIDIYERTTQSPEDYKLLQVELDSLFHDLYNLWKGPTPPAITPMLEILAKGIERETEFVVQKLERNLISRVAQSMEDEDEVLECYRRIQRLLQRVVLNVNLDAWKILDQLATDIRLNKLSPSETAWYSSGHSSVPLRGECTFNTRVDVLETLQTWATSNQTQKIYWLNGMAGTGKTTIAYSLCEYLKRTGKLAASFFCSRQLPECKAAHLIIPTISYQLSLISHQFKWALSQVMEKEPMTHALKLEEQFSRLIVEPLKQIQHTMMDDLVVVIDALDECDSKDGVTDMLKTLLSQAPGLPLKFFTTSRPEPKIRNLMMSEEGESTRLKLHLHELDQPVVKEDIKTYLRHRLEPIKVSPQDLELLAGRSGVLFIYAATAVRYISAEDFAWGSTRLKTVLKAPGSASSNKYKEIDTLYSVLINEALTVQTREDDEETAIRDVLHTVVCAQEPLTPDVVAGLLGLDDVATVRQALRALFSVLSVSETSGIVTTLHESFPDYLLNPTRSGLFHCDQKPYHARLATRCLALMMNAKPEFNICNIESSYLRDMDIPYLEERMSKVISKHLLYACKYWGDHVVSTNCCTNILDTLNDFLSTRLLLWMEILNLNRRLYVGAGLLARVQVWAQIAKCSETVQQFVQDAWKFTISVASSPVVESTPHIYVSTLAFWPSGRPMWKFYASRIQSLVKITGSTVQKREAALLAVYRYAESVSCISWSPDGSRIVSGSHDKNIRIWNAYTSQLIGEPLQGHTDTVWSVGYSPDGSRIVSGSSDKTIRIWDAHTGQLIGEPLQDHTSYVMSVAYSPDGSRIVSGSDDKSIRIWDAHTGQLIGESQQGHTSYLMSVAYSPDGSRIVSGSSDKTIRIWDAHTGQLIGEPLQGHIEIVYSVGHSPDGSRIVSGSSDKTIRIWDAHTGQLIGEPLQGHTDTVCSVGYSPDGSRIVSGSLDETILIWDAHTGQPIGEPLQGHTDTVCSVVYSPDGSRIVSGSHDKTIRIWDADTGQLPGEPLQGHTDTVYSVAYSPDGSRIVSGSHDNTICIWDEHTGQLIGEPLQGHTEPVCSVGYSPDGSRIVSGSSDKTIRIWDADTGQLIGEPLQGHLSYVRSVEYSPDGSRIVSGSHDNTICIWDEHTGQLIGEALQGHTNCVMSVAYSPDGSRIVSGSVDKTIRIWDAHTGQLIGEPLQGHTESVWSVGYSPDSSRIVSGSSDKTIRIWDARTGQLIGEPLQGHTGYVMSLAYSPDGSRIASGSEDDTIRIWDAHTGQLIGEPLQGHTESVWSVGYSPDSSRIVSGSSDETIRIWDAHTSHPMDDTLQGHSDYVKSDAYSPCGSPVVSGSNDEIIRISGACAERTSLRQEQHVITRFPNGSWKLNDEGWIVSQNSERLIWVPDDLRQVDLFSPPNIATISTRGSLRLDFENAMIGPSWRFIKF